MQAEKCIIETDSKGHPINFPRLPPNAKVEGIFLMLEDSTPTPRRKPSTKIYGKGQINGDLIEPVVASEDWQAMS
ncbi:MAG: hypothetical protein CMI09_08710 [Oceanospirillaceae bacterium]|nr:hypothetical protein [Oceanospirillaceae bacterium]